MENRIPAVRSVGRSRIENQIIKRENTLVVHFLAFLMLEASFGGGQAHRFEILGGGNFSDSQHLCVVCHGAEDVRFPWNPRFVFRLNSIPASTQMPKDSLLFSLAKAYLNREWALILSITENIHHKTRRVVILGLIVKRFPSKNIFSQNMFSSKIACVNPQCSTRETGSTLLGFPEKHRRWNVHIGRKECVLRNRLM